LAAIVGEAVVPGAGEARARRGQLPAQVDAMFFRSKPRASRGAERS